MTPILQTESSECGIACLAMVASQFGHQTDLVDLRRRFSVSLKGCTLAQLMRHASAMHLNTRPLRVDLDEMSALNLPCILHWNMNHFVVLKSVKKDFRGRSIFTVLDPASGERRLSIAEISAHFTGVALELSPSPAFTRQDARRRISITDLTGPIIGLRRAIFQVLALALALEVFAIASPLFNQFVLDEVIVSGDRQLLTVLVFGFALLMITQNAIGLSRSWFLMRWGMDVNLQWSARVLAHLMQLPVSYFEKRHLGDVVSRFGSIGAIQSTLTRIFVESALDGLMAIMAFGMMIIYSAKLSLLVAVAVMLYGVLRWIFYYPLREASEESLVLSSKESSHFLETIRAISPLKLFGREPERLSRWLNLKTDAQNRDIKTQKLSILFSVSNTTIFGAQSLAMFYIGAGLVMENAMTVGMLMAFSSYAGTFTGRISSLIDLFINLKMLSIHRERLADIAMEETESDVVAETDLSRISPTITLKDIKFRYSEGEPWVLNGVNLTIPPGQCVALVGPSGGGKTTLCKIVLGLLKPTEGEVLVDNIPLARLGIRAYRQLLGTVMQEDVLLAGSISENIGFFDSQIDTQLVEECAIKAAIHADIMAMPMGYQTLVGDMGSTLSGGQKQRVLLARALYKRPKILVLDEASSHLDLDNERKVNQFLNELPFTRLMVAHRPETIKAAERIVILNHGLVIDSAIELPSPTSKEQD